MGSSNRKASVHGVQAHPIAPNAPPRYPFAKLMALQSLGLGVESPSLHKYESFRALVAPFRIESMGYAYGGHVYAQAAYAASKTVERGFLLHNISGSFTLPGVGDIPFTFTVRHVREGATYCLRAVDVRQTDGVCFSCLCSFKRAEKKYNFEHQPVADIQRKYEVVLAGKDIEDHPLAPGRDTPEWTLEVERGVRQPVEFAGIEARKVKMDKYNAIVRANEHPDRYRQLHFYRLMGLPDDSGEGEGKSLEQIRQSDEEGEYDNLHICSHLYASDRNSLFLIARALGRASDITRIASLSHTVIIHTHNPQIKTIDWDLEAAQPRAKWFTIEASTSRSGENRVLHQGQIWAPDGTLIATTLQDGLLRVKDQRL